jgi:hypothetical protein
VGNATLFVDCVHSCNFEGVGFQAYNSGSALPSILFEGRGMTKIFATASNAIHTQGGFHYFSGLEVSASEYDNFNFDPSDDGRHSFVVVHDSRSFDAGDMETFATTGSVTKNRNGLSAHGGVDTIYAGISTGNNYGPNIAETGALGFEPLSFMIDVHTEKSLSRDAGISCTNATGSVEAGRKCWVGFSSTNSETVSLLGQGPAIHMFGSNNRLDSPQKIDGGATYLDKPVVQRLGGSDASFRAHQ